MGDVTGIDERGERRGKKNIDATLDGVQHRAFPRSA